MSGYVFVSNSNKPNQKEQEDRSPVKLSNVSRPCIKSALELKYDVYLGVNRKDPQNVKCDFPIKLYDQHTYRSVTALKDNWVAYKNLCKVIKESNVEVIHCNTPIGGMISRLAAKRHKVKKVIYTAHGFHFYKGAPLFNCTVLKWAEKIMAHWTDVIITMNQEDFEAAKKFKLKKGGQVYFVHGVGITLDEFDGMREKRAKKREELNLKNNDIALISAGDLVARKNYITAIQAIAKANNPQLQYFICGKGPEEESLKKLAKHLKLTEQIHFLGFRSDIKELLAASDIFLFTTKQEGLPRSMMEAMACGLPCIASKIRGNVDLVEDGEGGYLCSATDPDAFADAINKLANDLSIRDQMSKNNLEKIKQYDISVVEQEIKEIYNQVLKR